LTALSHFEPPHLPVVPRRLPAAGPRLLLAYIAFVVSGASSIAVLLWADPDLRVVLAPVLAASWIFAIFCSFLYVQDGQNLIFHAGIFAAVSALIYIALPAVFFALSEFEWSETSDSRLVLLRANVDDVADYVWRGVLYLSGFCVTYILVIWNSRKTPSRIVLPITTTDVAICAFIVAACFFYQTAVNLSFGVSLSQSDAEFPADGINPNLPLFIAQITHNIMAVQRIAKLALIVALVALWRNKWAKFALVVFMLSELFFTVALFGPRTYFAFLVLATVLSFHKMVRPIRGPVLAVGGILFLLLLLAYGYLRDYSNYASDFSTANEFQVLMGTGLHVREMVANGIKIPPQLPWSELLMLVPQQLLPFEKIDPSIWYLVESGLNETGSGYMFGVQSQAETGWGNPELFVRGVLLALVLGFFHRQYVKRPPGLLLTVSYIWLITTIYYSYRAATFYWVTFVAFRLLVFIGMFLAIRRIISIIRSDQGTLHAAR
jgi:hypothetical protein